MKISSLSCEPCFSPAGNTAVSTEELASVGHSLGLEVLNFGQFGNQSIALSVLLSRLKGEELAQ